MSDELLGKIEKINDLLRSFGPAAIQQIKMEINGKIVGQIRYGYRPQYVFDAVNRILKPENWRYEIVSKEVFENQAVAEVRLFIKTCQTEWLCKGSQTGQMNIVKKNVGDAYKGAVTDALQKCFSLLSVGCDAYRGLLEGVYKGTRQANSFKTYPSTGQNQPSKREPQSPPVDHPQQSKKLPPKQKRQPPQQKQSRKQPRRPSLPPEKKSLSINFPLPTDLPEISGVDWSWNEDGNKVIATGDTYNKKSLIKSSGFKFNGEEKHWYKEYSSVVQ